jgi:hypothetical protein
MHEAMKSAMGIDCANCSTCAYICSESDGAEPEYSVSWPVCRQFEQYEHLKPFPFKTEQKCWEPGFWHSKFTDLIDGSDESIRKAIAAFAESRDSVDAELASQEQGK